MHINITHCELSPDFLCLQIATGLGSFSLCILYLQEKLARDYKNCCKQNAIKELKIQAPHACEFCNKRIWRVHVATFKIAQKNNIVIVMY
jgi:hypothetical protein